MSKLISNCLFWESIVITFAPFGNKLVFTKDLMCDVIDNTVSGGRVVRFEYEKGDFHKIIDGNKKDFFEKKENKENLYL